MVYSFGVGFKQIAERMLTKIYFSATPGSTFYLSILGD
jgi:hypothetical protein